MSLHRYFAPPPLALAVHPAPPPRPRTSDKEKKAKAKVEAKAKAEAKGDGKGEGVGKEGGKDGKEDKGDGGKGGKDATPGQAGDAPPTPTTPGSMLPEPPTPAPGGEPAAKDGEKKEEKKGEAGKADVKRAKEDVTKVPLPKADTKDTPEKDSKEASDKKDEDKSGKEAEPTPEPEPLILLPPAPPRPLRTRLDLPPGTVYPPVNTDPRGAYHKYARAVGAEVIYVDVTKDGWLAEQWKERSEREALKRLTGEWEKELDREIEKQRKRAIKRKVPKTSEEVLLDLWNDLVEANNHEVSVDEFWNRYDWTDAQARQHLSPDLKRPEPPVEEKKDESADAGKDSEPAKKPVRKIEKPEIEWTRHGVEEILSTVGIQCAYNTEKPSSRHWSEPDTGYLLLAHGHFLLRLHIALAWKPEDQVNKGFEVLVTSAHDRVFGEMVKAQQAEDRKRREKEYRDRKEKERRERKAKEAKEALEGKGGEEKGKETPETPGSPASNAKVHNGDPVAPASPALTPDPKSDDKVVVAVPVPVSPGANANQPQADAKEKAQERDAKHEDDAQLVPGPKPAGEGQPLADGKEGKAKPDEADAKALAKAMSPGAPVGMDDIALALKALELAKNAPAGSPAAAGAKALASAAAGSKDKKEAPAAKKEIGPLFWTWAEKCEKWRWRNYEAGCHLVGPGGWEERDWQVFADGREAWDWDADQEEIEKVEVDVHDWSL
ncbi:hypothetical protein IAT38_000451 [Cryptococcus sp. DSM 104549]